MSSENSFEVLYWVCEDCGRHFHPKYGDWKPCGGVNAAVERFYSEDIKAQHEGASGVKHDDGKPRTDLLPAGALLEVARVLEHGAKKYGDNNWRNVQPRSRYIGALLRHLFALMEGEKLDKESGLNHIYHAACCALFLSQWEHEEETSNVQQ